MNDSTEKQQTIINPYNEKKNRLLTVLPDGTLPIPLGSGIIKSILGEGGVAVVYEIWSEKLGVSRAVKLLRPNNNPEVFSRFETEMKITAQLHHPNIIEIHSVGEWNNLPYIEMEKIEGITLDKLIKERGALPIPFCLAVGIAVCRALVFTHSHTYVMNGRQYKGILHRDLKPQNIMLSADGVAKIMDFGIATPTNVSLHTADGMVVGSLHYLAPEQLEGKPASIQSDLFSFGAVMYEMLTGVRTFSQTNMSKLISQRLRNEFNPLANYSLRIPRRLLKLVNSCLNMDIHRRPSSSAEVLEVLERLFSCYTKKKPEDIISFFLSSEPQKRNVVYCGKVASYKKTMLIAMPIGIALLTIPIFLLFNVSKPISTKQPDSITRTNVDARTDSTLSSATTQQHKFSLDNNSKIHVLEKSKNNRHNNEYAVKKKISSTSTTAITRPNPTPKQKTTIPNNNNELSSTLPPAIAALATEYGTYDLTELFIQQIMRQRYNSALDIYELLPSEKKRQKQILLYKLRALQGAKNYQVLANFLSAEEIDDMEFYLSKAEYMQGKGQYSEAIRLVEKAMTTQPQLGDRQILTNRALYCKALCLSGIFEKNPNDDNRERALQSWFDVKYAYRNNMSHAHFLAANEQIRKLSKTRE